MIQTQRSLSLKLLGAVLALFLSSTAALGDEEGFIDNWPGDLKVTLKHYVDGQPTVIDAPPALVGPSLRERFDTMWAETRPRICDTIRADLERKHLLAVWHVCTIAATGELRGRQLNPSLFPNRLDLKYVVTGNHFGFEAATDTFLGSWANPLIVGKFNITLNASLVFDKEVQVSQAPLGFDPPAVTPDPPDLPARGPMTLASGKISFWGAAFASNYDTLPVASDIIVPKLRAAEADFNAQSPELTADAVGIRAININLWKGALAMARVLDTADQRTPYFLLDTSMGGGTYKLAFIKPRSAPTIAPAQCNCASYCDRRIGCTCAGAGAYEEGDQFVLQRLVGGGWVYSGHSEVWSVTGSSLQASAGETITARVCRINAWGRICGDQVSFPYQDVGACTVPDPIPPPNCPPGERECPGHSGCTPIGQCEEPE